jgi:hypothetical protein
VRGGIYLRDGFHSDGEVSLIKTTVGGDLDASRGTFNSPNGYALNAAGIDVKGGVFLRDEFSATGEVRLRGASVRSDLEVMRASFGSRSAFILRGAKVEGTFLWIDITTDGMKGSPQPLDVILDLSDASAKTLMTRRNGWPTVGNLYLDGFKYDRFEIWNSYDTVPGDWHSEIAWFRLAGSPAQQYVQLAEKFAKQDDDYDARKVRVAPRRDQRLMRPWYGQIWPWILEYSSGMAMSLGAPSGGRWAWSSSAASHSVSAIVPA